MPSYNNRLFIASKAKVQDQATHDALLEIERWVNAQPFVEPAPPPTGGLVPADDFTAVPMTNPDYGGTMQVMQTTRNGDILIAIGKAGDSFPRMLIDGFGNIWLGDGSFDPYDQSVSYSIQPEPFGGGLRLVVGASSIELSSAFRVWVSTSKLEMGSVAAPQDILFTGLGSGPIIRSPDGSQYRIVVNNAGVLSTVFVP